MIALSTNKEEQEIEEREFIMKEKIELRKNMVGFLSTITSLAKTIVTSGREPMDQCQH